MLPRGKGFRAVLRKERGHEFNVVLDNKSNKHVVMAAPAKFDLMVGALKAAPTMMEMLEQAHSKDEIVACKAAFLRREQACRSYGRPRTGHDYATQAL